MPTNRYLSLLNGLLARISHEHPAFATVSEEVRRVDAGLYGEAYYAELLTEQGYSVLRDLTIHQQQMDLLVLTTYAVVVMEVKNIRGNVKFATAPRQLVRKLENGEVNIFTSPFVQLENSVRVLRQLFTKLPYHLPVFGAVCFPFQTALITGDTRDFPVLIGRDVLNYLGRLETGEAVVGARQQKALIRMLQQASVPFERPMLCKKFKIDVANLKKGCRCTRCNTVGMRRLYGTWFCPACTHTSRDAHLTALVEYANFVSEEITLQEAMDFLGLENRYIARRMLYSVKAKRIGNVQNTKYILPRSL